MKQFFADNGSAVKKLFLNQFGAIVFGLMIVMLSVMTEQPVVAWLTAFVSVFFYLYLIFLTVWEKGASDILKVQGGRLSPRANEGLKIGIAVNIPVAFFAVVYSICILLALFANAGSSVIVANTASVSSVITRILSAPYISLFNVLLPDSGNHPVWTLVFWLLTPIPAAFVSWFGYRVGYSGKYVPASFRQKKK